MAACVGCFQTLGGSLLYAACGARFSLARAAQLGELERFQELLLAQALALRVLGLALGLAPFGFVDAALDVEGQVLGHVRRLGADSCSWSA